MINPEDLVVIEMGAGEAIPTVRNQQPFGTFGATLIRLTLVIFMDQTFIPIASGAKDALLTINALIH